ncbi:MULTISPECIES: class I SAM-dependent DNA methyltransferase [Cyanophyceae]|uniref:class I SAM-dependent DNA methyltransferase n=1 Tax=Cyanophyceae TaxID=3028117 RepID=UPI00232C78DA|nr:MULTISPECIES: TaqI-like C-terminal specificity domain-containing protein [Cyanophyceae]MDB9355712.1 TaqI-like C-terminal specificity domain-containing protein [Nodularia spumigena CS-587/03]MDB9341638.1 TaqI-like C-terminal specificity domain-containing protein [Nodularia spumigena CS-589/07]MDB9398420.1 TaqI-like C-terminal specificity domain-containing protein [Microcystis aeruginosa CS-567/02-A1]MDB9500322.1 TaqI-like C-terminal specificity domain-containing protein [Nodularia spumigena C
MNKIQPRQALNKAFLKVKPNRVEIDQFKTHLSTLLAQINEAESEEFHKNLIADFLKNTYYSPNHFINTKGRNDLVIHNGKDAQSNVGVILETKKPTNKGEMLKVDNLNTKAFQELVLYFLGDRITNKNLEIKYLIATNIYEWFIFDANTFEQAFIENKAFLNQFTEFEAGRLSSKKTEFFYKEIAQPAIAQIQDSIPFTYFDIRDYAEILNQSQQQNDHQLIALFKLLSPEHLLKLPFANDSNSLDKGFYSELLHIIGLTETKEGSKKLIQRKKAGERNSGSLIENAIVQLDSLDKISRLKKPDQFGETYQDQLFNLGLELSITWINRILFLKLLEAQLIKYHKNDKSFGFLNLEKIKNFDDLNSLFFSVLARKPSERSESLQKIFSNVPYLNSSLFEPTDIEQVTIFISNLRDENLQIFSSSVLKDSNGKKRTGEINTLQYLFEFLNAYDFSSEGSEEIQEDNKRLINASVLGLIFEKINGYKDGSFFTPGFITMYMCRETIRRAVLQKFNQAKGWNCQDINQLYEKISDKPEANQIINSLKICDPAVGSGHFLVSALNEIIAIKSELKILLDRSGKTLRDYHVEVVNDELVITDNDGELFEYNPKNKESQRIQETLFHEKQTIIENCLFGVDINPNSVKICRLRLWIELLKNAYYKAESNYTELETLPNIDINIKCGNSLISRFALDADLRQALKKKQYSINNYRHAVETYRNAENKQQKREMEKLIKDIKGNFQTTLGLNDPNKTKLRRLEVELYNLENQMLLFEETKAEKKTREKKVTKLNNEIDKLKAEIDDIQNGQIYENSLEWRFEFPEVLDNKGEFVGFDVVIGNPPYIRQEEIKDLKPILQQSYQCYTGIADLFVYFYELGLKLLKPKGDLTYISSNKYFRAGYGEKLRQLLTTTTTIHSLIDFGDFPVFEEAIAYPSIITLSNDKSDQNQVKALSWDKAKKENIAQFATVLNQSGVIISQENLNLDGWRLESSDIIDLLGKIRNAGTPLGEYVNGRFYYGIKTGFNQAFVVDQATRDKLINEHPSSAEVLKPFLRGRDVKRWCVEFANQYIIKIESSENKKHPWSDKPEKEAEKVLAITYPAIYQHFTQFREALIKRCDQGKFFWELRSCIYWEEFEQPKIIIPAIINNVEYAPDFSGYYSNDKTSICIPKNINYTLAILNSSLMWWFIQQIAASKQGGFFEFKPMYVSQIPIATATEPQRILLEQLVEQILTAKKSDTQADTTALEAEIDQLVYQLYGLTAEEIQIIEDKNNG